MNFQTSRILLVDDDPSVRATVEDVLRPLRCGIESVPTGEEALARARTESYDLVLLDLGLPDMDGFQVLRSFKEDDSIQGIPIIVLTALNSTQDKVKGFDLGAADYVTKPFEAAELRARVHATLRTKQLQDELKQANAQLLEASRSAEAANVAKSEFLARMCHEIRTPMNGVLGVTDLLLDSQLTREQQDWVETIRSSGDTLLAVVNDILDFSKVEAGKMTVEMNAFPVEQCVAESVSMLAARASQKGVELTFQIENNVPSLIVGDALRLRQVLTNLISNAIKFTLSGEVSVTVSGRELAEIETAKGILAVTARPDGARPWEFSFKVRDTGIGIPADRLPLLFGRYIQADSSTTRKFGGTGLGLAICRSLVDLLGGRITVESEPGKGSTFQVIFCAYGLNESAASVKPPVSLQGTRLFIVDDNATNRRILTAYAERWNMRATSVQDGAEALKLIRDGVTFDVGILDMQMPGIDGLTLAYEIKKHLGQKAPPLILLTSLGLPSKSAVEWQVFASCMGKPVRPAQLLAAIQECVSKSQLVHPKPASAPRIDSSLAAQFPLKILLVDDNSINRKVAQRILEQMGYVSDLATNGLEAVAAATAVRYDLILMDVQMPELDGLDATKRIRQNESTNGLPRPVIIAMTANALPGDREKCLACGMDDYFTKPIRPDIIRNVIVQWGKKTPAIPPAAPVPTSTRTEPEEEPVDIKRLRDFANDDPESLRELVDIYLQQTEGQFAKIKAALVSGDAREIQRVAHSCAGASATCGMNRIVPHLREMERCGMEKRLADVDAHLSRSEDEYQRIKTCLESLFKEMGSR